MADAAFVNPIPNPARYKKSNGATLDALCEAAYQGDLQTLEVLLRSGDEDHIFNGDVNTHFTDITALHMAAMAGHLDCVQLLLEAKADPHVRASVPEGKDPQTGEKARDKAAKFKHDNVADLLRKAEESTPLGWYQTEGIGNNRKFYSAEQAAKATAAAKGLSTKEAAAAPPKEAANKPPAADAKKEATPAAKAAAQPQATATPPPAPREPSLPVALLFPGQGSQYVKMLDGVKEATDPARRGSPVGEARAASLTPWMDNPEVKTMLATAKSILGYDLLELCLQGPEEKLAETRYCQPAMFVGGLAGVAKLRSEKPEAVARAQCMAGLSLGEYTALCAAGVFSFEDGLKLVKLRGEAMQEAAQVGKQGMVSVVGLERNVLDGLCDEAAKTAGAGEVCKVANVLFPKGFSCAGTEKAVKTLEELAMKKGALQAKILKTSGGFHTSLMQPAQQKLQAALEETFPNMKPPVCDVYMNVNAEPMKAGTEPKAILDLLSRQLVSPVLWHTIVDRMIKDGVTDFYECGPQKQIKAMMKRIDAKVWNKTTNVEV